MDTLCTVADIRAYRASCREKGQRIGLVPTMGYLHDGHLALVKEARRHTDKVVVSVYVNPTQFGVGEDLDRYPRDLERDHRLLEEIGTDLLWTPGDAHMYPEGACTFVTVEGPLSSSLCGAARPTHFRGVTTVVAKLLQILQPEVAVFGLKDYQQFQIVRRMAHDLFLETELIGLPTFRESDGLAMSSRNALLTPEDRAKAPVIRRSLLKAASAIGAGHPPAEALAAVSAAITEAGGRVDYVDALSAESLERYPEAQLRGGVESSSLPLLIAVAAFFGGARLIDNIVVDPGGGVEEADVDARLNAD